MCICTCVLGFSVNMWVTTCDASGSRVALRALLLHEQAVRGRLGAGGSGIGLSYQNIWSWTGAGQRGLLISLL